MTHGPLMFDLEGLVLTQEEKERLLHPAAGGIILFSRNYESPTQLAELVQEIHAARLPALLVSVDQEGGRVQRFRDGFTELPPAANLGHLYQTNPDRARRAAKDLGWLMAAELRSRGVDFSFAPVLDLDSGMSKVIGDRAFNASPETISKLAFSWTSGAKETGMASVGKHFPGHGCVEADSHHELPIDCREFDEIWQHDLIPFQHLIKNGLQGIMPAHVIYSACDQQPAGYSKFWIQEVLRSRMGFDGVVFSDDLSMEAANTAGSYPERARQALSAGCDMVLACNNPTAAAQILDELSDYSNPAAQARLVRMHGRGHLSIDQLHENPRWRSAVNLASELGDHSSLDLDF